jgi:hypothetical protein
MKNLLLLLFPLLLIGCNNSVEPAYDTVPPPPPSNVKVTAYSNEVDITWKRSTAYDFSHYNVYVNSSYQGDYLRIGSTTTNFFADIDAVNGTPYYYAVTAVDLNGNESELSYDMAYAIPRPEGFNEIVYDFRNYPDNAGFSLAQHLRVPYDSQDADFFFENYNGVYYLDVWSDTDIQDAGPTSSIYDITVAPVTGWVPVQQGENIKYAPAIIGHTYIIWTVDNHFAKIRISNITPQRVQFDWAYQLIEGETHLKKISRSNSDRHLTLERN